MNGRSPGISSYPKLPLSWSKDETCSLLRILRYHPILYDPNHPEYNFPLLRTKAYKQISDEMKVHKSNVSAEIVRNKFKVLKKQFLDEKKAKEEYLKNRKKTDGPYRPKLWCYSLMRFFEEKRDYNKIKRASSEAPTSFSASSVEKDDCILTADSLHGDGELESANQQKILTPNPESRRDRLNAKCLQLVKNIADTFESIKGDRAKEAQQSSDQSPKTFLGLMIQSELSKVNEEIYEEAKWKIIRILEEASKRHRADKNVPPQFKTPPVAVTPLVLKSPQRPLNKQLYLGKGVKVVTIKDHGIKNSTITKFDSICTNSINLS